jgi:hypothetical protein
MPDQNEASAEHAIIQEIAEPLETLPDDPVGMAADVHFPVVLRGYDRIAVDAYVKHTTQLIAELHATRSPEAAVRRALERVGEQVAGILQRAHEAAESITERSRAEADDRLERASREAIELSAEGERRVKDLDAETDAIWAERRRIVADVSVLAGKLSELAESALERFPPEELPDQPAPEEPGGADAAPDPDSAFDRQATAVMPTLGNETEHQAAGAEHEPVDAAHEPVDAEHEPAGAEHEPVDAAHEAADAEHEGADAEHEGADAERDARGTGNAADG